MKYEKLFTINLDTHIGNYKISFCLNQDKVDKNLYVTYIDNYGEEIESDVPLILKNIEILNSKFYFDYLNFGGNHAFNLSKNQSKIELIAEWVTLSKEDFERFISDFYIRVKLLIDSGLVEQ